MNDQSFSCRAWLRDSVARRGLLPSIVALAKGAWEIALDYLPWRRRLRYGDVDFDWDYRVDTTWSNLPLRTRVREIFAGRGYQPSDPLTFHAMMAQLAIDPRLFTFVDLGAGKGRALLMASEYPFRRIIGVELLPELHAIALQNIRKYSSARQRCRNFELHCQDARSFQLPPEPLVLFLFDPFPADILRQVIAEVERSLREAPRQLFVAYQNPLSEQVLLQSSAFRKLAGDIAYAIFEVSTSGHQPPLATSRH